MWRLHVLHVWRRRRRRHGRQTRPLAWPEWGAGPAAARPPRRRRAHDAPPGAGGRPRCGGGGGALERPRRGFRRAARAARATRAAVGVKPRGPPCARVAVGATPHPTSGVCAGQPGRGYGPDRPGPPARLHGTSRRPDRFGPAGSRLRPASARAWLQALDAPCACRRLRPCGAVRIPHPCGGRPGPGRRPRRGPLPLLCGSCAALRCAASRVYARIYISWRQSAPAPRIAAAPTDPSPPRTPGRKGPRRRPRPL
jgi:hypothetical protein